MKLSCCQYLFLYYFVGCMLNAIEIDDSLFFLNSTGIDFKRNINVFTSSVTSPEAIMAPAVGIYNHELHIVGGCTGFSTVANRFNMSYVPNTYHLMLNESNLLSPSNAFIYDTTSKPTQFNTTNMASTNSASIPPITTNSYMSTYNQNTGGAGWEVKYNNVPLNNSNKTAVSKGFICVTQLYTTINEKLYIIASFYETKPSAVDFSKDFDGLLFYFNYKFLLIFDMNTKEYVDMNAYSSIIPGGINNWILFYGDVCQCLTNNETHLYIVGLDSSEKSNSSAILIYNIQMDEWKKGSNAVMITFKPSCFYIKKTKSVYMYQGVDLSNGVNLPTEINLLQIYNTVTDKWRVVSNNTIKTHFGQTGKSILFNWQRNNHTIYYLLGIGTENDVFLDNIFDQNITEFMIHDNNILFTDPKYYSIPYENGNSRINLLYDTVMSPVVKYGEQYVLIFGGRQSLSNWKVNYLSNIMIINVTAEYLYPTLSPTVNPTKEPTSHDQPVGTGTSSYQSTIFGSRYGDSNDTHTGFGIDTMLLYSVIGIAAFILVVSIVCIYVYYKKKKNNKLNKNIVANSNVSAVKQQGVQLMSVKNENAIVHITKGGDKIDQNPNINPTDIVIDGDSDNDQDNDGNCVKYQRLLSNKSDYDIDITDIMQKTKDGIVVEGDGEDTKGNINDEEFIVQSNDDVTRGNINTKLSDDGLIEKNENIITIGDNDIIEDNDNDGNNEMDTNLDTIM